MKSSRQTTSLPPEGFDNLVQGRRSIRRYAEGQIEPAVLDKLLECACWAPSAHNRQPWRFCIVTDQSTKQLLAKKMGIRWSSDLARDGAPAAEIEQRVAASNERLTKAGALIIMCMSMDDMNEYADAERQAAERTMAIQSVALAGQNLLLAAHVYGLGACWMCAPLFAQDLVRETLDLPPSWEAQALVTVGYPAEERTSQREPLHNRVLWR